MALTNAERQKRWRDKRRGFGLRTRREITMADIVNLLERETFKRLAKWRVYAMLNAQRDNDAWTQLWFAIRMNEEGRSAPVQVLGSGRRNDPFTLVLSEDWDWDRDWDAEQRDEAAGLRVNPVPASASHPQEEF